jgi:hypothetical protein
LIPFFFNPENWFFLRSSVEIKMVVLINFQNVVKKIHLSSVRFILKLKMKGINKEKRIIQINFRKHVQVNPWLIKMFIYKLHVRIINNYWQIIQDFECLQQDWMLPLIRISNFLYHRLFFKNIESH